MRRLVSLNLRECCLVDHHCHTLKVALGEQCQLQELQLSVLTVGSQTLSLLEHLQHSATLTLLRLHAHMHSDMEERLQQCLEPMSSMQCLDATNCWGTAAMVTARVPSLSRLTALTELCIHYTVPEPVYHAAFMGSLQHLRCLANLPSSRSTAALAQRECWERRSCRQHSSAPFPYRGSTSQR